VAGVGEESFEKVGAAGLAILDRGDGAGEGAGVAGAKLVDGGLALLIQIVSVKQEPETKKRRATERHSLSVSYDSATWTRPMDTANQGSSAIWADGIRRWLDRC